VPGAAQTPQLALQQTSPTLQVFIPHGRLTGIVGPPVHACGSHGTPGAAQVPQLSLQQTCPTLQVFLPHETLTGGGGPHAIGLHGTPGAAQIPQLSLQQTCPTSHVLRPQGTVSSAAVRLIGKALAAIADLETRDAGGALPLFSAQMPQGMLSAPAATTSTIPIRGGKSMPGA
jgi:hypothetical protein